MASDSKKIAADSKKKAQWLPLESNPDAVNAFLTTIGVPSLECVDVFSFEADMIEFVPRPHLAVLLCFPGFDQLHEKRKALFEPIKDLPVNENLFFMKQEIGNACGTFALFHSLANNEHRVDLGTGSFKQWLDRARSSDPDDRSSLLEDDDVLARAHEATARAGDTHPDEDTQNHFIAYVVRDGRLWELDSSAPVPRDCGECTEDDLLVKVGDVSKELIQASGDSISFSALALVGK